MPQVIVVLVKNGNQYNTAVVPWRVQVAFGPQTITWTASGPNAIFPAPPQTYFWWKTDPPPLNGEIPQRSSDGKTLTLAYDNEGLGDIWSYGIAVMDSANNVTINIDPEIENTIPPPVDQERGKGKDKDEDKPRT